MKVIILEQIKDLKISVNGIKKGHRIQPKKLFNLLIGQDENTHPKTRLFHKNFPVEGLKHMVM